MEPSPLSAVNSLLLTPSLPVSLEVSLTVCLPVSPLLTAPQRLALANFVPHELSPVSLSALLFSSRSCRTPTPPSLPSTRMLMRGTVSNAVAVLIRDTWSHSKGSWPITETINNWSSYPDTHKFIHTHTHTQTQAGAPADKLRTSNSVSTAVDISHWVDEETSGVELT